MTIEKLSIKYFGTPNYESVLAVLAPSSEAVRKFNAEVEKLKKQIRKE